MSEKILFLDFFQPFAQYRNPFTFEYAQVYPLPPKTTIVGMLQSITNKYYDPDFWNLKISINGFFESYFWNYQNLIKGEISIDSKGKLINRQDKNISNHYYYLYHSKIKARRSPTHQQELFNGRLYIFIRGESDIIDQIKEALEKPKKIVRLGRSEDVVFINEVMEIRPEKTVEVKKSIKLTYPMYLKDKITNECMNPVYYIPVKTLFKNEENLVRCKGEIFKDTERETKFETVIYTGFNKYLKLKESETFQIFKINNSEFRISEKYGWL